MIDGLKQKIHAEDFPFLLSEISTYALATRMLLAAQPAAFADEDDED